MVKEIPLTQGKIALVDDEDYERVIQHKWYTKRSECNWYAITNKYSGMIWLHRFILNLKSNERTDHINGDGLDNRRCNLRLVTNAQNMMNCRKHSDGSSKYKGVSWRKGVNKWLSLITFNYKCIYLGLYSNEEDAARAYDKAAKELFGGYARLNFPEVK